MNPNIIPQGYPLWVVYLAPNGKYRVEPVIGWNFIDWAEEGDPMPIVPSGNPTSRAEYSTDRRHAGQILALKIKEEEGEAFP